MIDEFRKQIQDRLDQLMTEVSRVRRALAALGGGDQSAPAGPARRPTRARATGPSGAKAGGRRSAASGTDSRSRAAARVGSSSSGSSASVTDATRGRLTGQRSGTRAAQGQTRSAVLAALSSGEAMTAGEVAAATGLGRASVSTTLSKLAKRGEWRRPIAAIAAPNRHRSFGPALARPHGALRNTSEALTPIPRIRCLLVGAGSVLTARSIAQSRPC